MLSDLLLQLARRSRRGGGRSAPAERGPPVAVAHPELASATIHTAAAVGDVAAALIGHLGIVKLLVELGADPTAEAVDDTPGQFTPPDRTALGWARYNHQDDVVAYLARRTSDGPRVGS